MLRIFLWPRLTLAINKIIETSTAMELSLVNKLTLGADELTSMSATWELSIFIQYINHITNTLYERFLCLIPLASSKNACALHEAMVMVFSDWNLNIKNIFSVLSMELTPCPVALLVFKDICVLKVCFQNISITGAIALFMCLFTGFSFAATAEKN